MNTASLQQRKGSPMRLISAMDMKIRLMILAIPMIAMACKQKHVGQKSFTYFSENVRDSFDIYITLPNSFKKDQPLNVFYYLDANIKSGNKIREIIRDSSLKPDFTNSLFVGIGHRGDFHVLRRRDFTVPQIVGPDTLGVSTNFGHIERFYQFLTQELIPYINTHYNTNKAANSILGHSFGGLFTVYALFKNDTIFKNYYALSPSLWVSDYSVYKFNNLTPASGKSKSLFISVGGLELLNRIKSGTDEFDRFLKGKNYESLRFTYIVYPGETHNSEVPYALTDILCRKQLH
ncbi:MAG: alpha/beta hydrolase-fold protein [Ferruginibacter sp.]